MADHDEDCMPSGHPSGCGCPDCVRTTAIEPDEVVEGIDPECAGEVGLIVFRGFLASSGIEGLWRLYLTLSLTDYILLRDEDIVSQHTNGAGSIVWVRPSRVVRQIRVRSARDLQAEFLEGEIERRKKAVTDLGGVEPYPSDAGGVPAAETWDCPKSNWTRCNPH